LHDGLQKNGEVDGSVAEAAAEVRAARRFEQMRQSGEAGLTLAEVERQVRERDARDSSRAESPLRRDGSYQVIDTGLAGPEEVVEQMVRCIEELSERLPAPRE
jgi:cytidylate kinase